jgi:hypothetical protein
VLRLLFILLFSASAHADWERRDTELLAATAALTVMDWGQTRNTARNPDRFYERNPFLGRHPSVGDVDKYFTAYLLYIGGVSYLLPPRERRWFLTAYLVYEGGVVGANHYVGVRMDF